jgi:predicted HNH restriction endonuclease
MARKDLRELYKYLVRTRFGFLPPGEHHLRQIYKAVKDRYPDLCDDAFLCITNCRNGYNSPEWRHVVRKALNNLKDSGGRIDKGLQRGFWLLDAAKGRETAPSEEEYLEGKRRFRLHRCKERNPKVVKRKKCLVLAETGKLLCEVCSFDFEQAYGDIGRGFAECHHRVPLAELEEDHPTKLSELSIVCANCHRMLHRSGLSVEELRKVVERKRAANSSA